MAGDADAGEVTDDNADDNDGHDENKDAYGGNDGRGIASMATLAATQAADARHS